MLRLSNQFDAPPADREASETTIANYERIHRHMLHYEALMYSSTGPILAICLPLGGVALGAVSFTPRVQIFAAIAGAILALFALITSLRLDSNVKTYTNYLKEIEKQTGFGHLRRYGLDQTIVRKMTPNILRMRSWMFLILFAFFVIAALMNWLAPEALQASAG